MVAANGQVTGAPHSDLAAASALRLAPRKSELRKACPVDGQSIVPGDALDSLVALLRLQRHHGDWPGLEPAERDRLAGHFAIAIFALVEAANGAIDLGDELALAV